MKLKHLYTISILLVIMSVFAACSKQDRSPKLIVHIQDLNGVAIVGATVHVWPSDDLEIDSTSSGVPDLGMDQIGISDAAGDAFFDLEFSAVLDVDVTYSYTSTDGNTSELTGHKVVKVEVVEQKEEENIFNETVTIQ